MNRTAVRFQRGAPLADLGSLIELSILYFSGTHKRFAAFVFLIFPQKRKKAQNIGVYQAAGGAWKTSPPDRLRRSVPPLRRGGLTGRAYRAARGHILG